MLSSSHCPCLLKQRGLQWLLQTLVEGCRNKRLIKRTSMFCREKPKRAGAAHQGSVTRNLAHFGFRFAFAVALGRGGSFLLARS